MTLSHEDPEQLRPSATLGDFQWFFSPLLPPAHGLRPMITWHHGLWTLRSSELGRLEGHLD
jgi:hypothetical protein